MGLQNRLVDLRFPRSRSSPTRLEVVVVLQDPCYVFSRGRVKVFESRERGTFHVSLTFVISFWSKLCSWDVRVPSLKYLSKIPKLLSERTFKFPCSIFIKLPSMELLSSEYVCNLMF